MKNNIIKLIFSLLITLIIISCNDRWDKMNTDPNKIESLPDEYLFTSAVRQTFRTSLERFDFDLGGQYAHIYVSNSWVRETDKYLDYNAQGDISEEVFSNVYNNQIRNINEVIELTKTGGEYENPIRNAQAVIIQIINFAKLTDMFGDIPYFEGGLGKYGVMKPKYDKQEVIYSDMDKRLKESIILLKNSKTSDGYPSNIDPVYKGDIQKWIRFANSFRLRLAMRAKNGDAQKYNAVIAECLAEPLIETNQQNATLTSYDDMNDDMYNPLYTILSVNKNLLNWSEKFINILKQTADPRLNLFSTNIKGNFNGMPNGLTDAVYSTLTRSNFSAPTSKFFAKDQPMYLITASEIWLLRAELAINGAAQGDANSMYQTGIKLAMQQWKLNDADIQTYILSQNEATLSGDATNKLRQIATQLWISFVPYAFESWSTIRRTGYPVIEQRTSPNLSQGVTNGLMPSRVKYPYTVEKIVNGENLANAIANIGGDKIETKLWWNKK